MNPYVSSNTNLPETTGESESAGGIVTFVTNLTASCSVKTGDIIVSLITSTKLSTKNIDFDIEIDGGINFGANIFYNNDMILANNFVMNNNQMIGNEETSILIVRANAELQSNSSITGHQYYDIDDGGGFTRSCTT